MKCGPDDNESLPPKDEAQDGEQEHEQRETPRPGAPPASVHHAVSRRALWLVGAAVLLPLAAGLTYGATRYDAREREVNRTAAEQRNFVPAVRTAQVQPAGSDYVITLPATTLAFAQANIFA